ncbi:MAG: hypothetical protein KAT11_03775 [Phycisphaerae bacterium]|nr:hypothetical protein [Phycisphaerae bacterium]
MKKLVEDTFCITAKEAAKALPRDSETGKVSLEIAGSYSQEIAVVSTASNLEGLVRWFICPACQNRVGKLYLPPGEAVFLCRTCHDLAYRAQQLRAFRRRTKPRIKPRKKKYTEEDWLREAMAFLKKQGIAL